MKRKILGVLFFCISSHLFSQAAVIDVSAIAAAIENGYTLYKELQQTVNSLKVQYEMLENSARNLMSFDPSKYDLTKWEEWLHITDDYMTSIDNLESVYTAKNMKFSGVNFSISDLYTTDVYKRVLSNASDSVNPSKMTEADKIRFYKKHGLSPEHYAKLHAVTEQMNESFIKGNAAIIAGEDSMRSALESADDLVKNSTSEDSETANSQKLLKGIGDTLRVACQQYQVTSDMYKSVVAALNVTNQEKSLGNDLDDKYSSQKFGIGNYVGEEKDYIGPGKKKGFQFGF